MSPDASKAPKAPRGCHEAEITHGHAHHRGNPRRAQIRNGREAEPHHRHQEHHHPEDSWLRAGVGQPFADVLQRRAQAERRGVVSALGAMAHEKQGQHLRQVAERADQIADARAEGVDDEAGTHQCHRQRHLAASGVESNAGRGALASENVRHDRLPGRCIDGCQRRGDEHEAIENDEVGALCVPDDHQHANGDVEGERGELGDDEQLAAVETIRQGATVEPKQQHPAAPHRGDETHEHDAQVRLGARLHPDDLRHELERAQRVRDQEAKEQKAEVAHGKRREHAVRLGGGRLGRQ